MTTTETTAPSTINTLIAAAAILAHTARRQGRYDLMRQARSVGTTLDACKDSDPDVLTAFARASYKLLTAIEREVWTDPTRRPHFADVLDSLGRHGIELLPWQVHTLARYFA